MLDLALTSVMSFCPRAGRLVTLVRLSTTFFLEDISLGSFCVTMYLFTFVSSSIFCSRLSGVAPALCQRKWHNLQRIPWIRQMLIHLTDQISIQRWATYMTTYFVMLCFPIGRSPHPGRLGTSTRDGILKKVSY